MTFIFIMGLLSGCLIYRAAISYTKKQAQFLHLHQAQVSFLLGNLFILSFHLYPSIHFMKLTLISSLLVYASLVDIYVYLIPDRVHIILIGIGMVFNQVSFVGLLFPSLPLFILALTTQKMGLGDIKLIASAGLLLGYPLSVIALFIACLISLIVHFRTSDRIPFGPYLSIGILICLYYGDFILALYNSLG